MRAPAYTAADYLTALQALMPRGRVWPRDPAAIQTKTLSGLASSFQRVSDRANQLLVDGFPATTTELLSEWEESLGLPDPCAGEGPTLQLRRAQVVARFAGGGGQSVPYIIAYAANLGYTITITQFLPARVGMLHAGDPLCGLPWAFAWRVNAPTYTISAFRAGISAAGEPLSVNGNAVLECELESISPAHTTVIFKYS